MSAVNLKREELYERVWSAPMIKVATEFGISDVALKKTCKRLNVPTPPRGYWAKLEAGHRPKKIPLPAPPIVEARKDLAVKEAQRLHATPSPGPKTNVGPPSQKLASVPLPVDNRNLHPIARELKAAVLAETPDQQGMMHIHQRVDVPSVQVSKQSVDALVRSFHVILSELESRGVEFRRFRGKYGHPSFHCGKYQITISISEVVETIKREPTEKEKRRPSWEWNLTSQQPSGRFIFEISEADSYYSRHSRNRLVQKPQVPLEEITAQVIEAIWDTFVAKEKKRIEDEERWEREKEASKIREEEERKARHETALRTIRRNRQENLLRAAQWWKIEDTTTSYIEHCERSWRAAGTPLTAEQEEWLSWARAQVIAVSPQSISYPDPKTDGSFDPAAVPFGGPYPPTREVPRPPTMPAPPEPPNEVHHHHSYGTTQPYPFWLKHQH